MNSQSQSDATELVADQTIELASTSGAVKASAPKHILLTAGGAAIKIEKGKITLSGSGKVQFKAGMKELAPGGSVSASLKLKKGGEVKGCATASAARVANGASAI